MGPQCYRPPGKGEAGRGSHWLLTHLLQTTENLGLGCPVAMAGARASRGAERSRSPGSLPDNDCRALKRQGLCVIESLCQWNAAPTTPCCLSNTEADCCLSSHSQGPAYPGPLPRFEVPGRPGGHLSSGPFRGSTEDGPVHGESNKSTRTSMPLLTVGCCCGE